MRLFLAVWPDAALRRELTALLGNLRPLAAARWIPPEKLHLTIVFLGDIAAERLTELESAVGDCDHPPDSLILDRLELWRRAGVLCLVPTVAPPALIEMSDRISERLRVSGFAIKPQTFRPHLTLARHASTCPSYDLDQHPAFAWTSRSLTLVESRQEQGKSYYLVLKTWPLKTHAS